MRKMVVMFFSSLTLSLVEFIGLALIFPFLRLVTDQPFRLNVMSVLSRLGLHVSETAQGEMVVLLGVGMVAIFGAKGYLQVKLVRVQAQIGAEVNREASQRLIEKVLLSRFQLFQEHGAVKLGSISQSNTAHASLLFLAATNAINEAILLGFIFIAVFAVAPTMVLIALGVLAGVGKFYFSPISRRISMLGAKTQNVDHARYRFVYAMANAIRDIKIMGLETNFIKRNNEIANEHVQLLADYSVAAAIPRVSIEMIMVSSIVFACIGLVIGGGDLVSMAPALATLALMAMRAGPALTRLVATYNGVRYSLPFVRVLQGTWQMVETYPQKRTHDEEVSFEGTLRIRALSFSYDGKPVLKDVSLDLTKGKVIAIVGASGSGKSTLLDLIAGLQEPASGTFELNGVNIKPFTSASYSARIGYVPQSIALFDASLAFNVSLEESPDFRRLEYAIAKAHLSSLVDGMPNGLETLLGEAGQGISGGQRQRIGIARALYRQPSLLILDEVTSALDPKTQQSVMNELLELRGNTTLLVVTHDMQIATYADHIYQLNGGVLHEHENKQRPIHPI